MKKQLLLATIATVLMATTSNFLVGLTVGIDRTYAKDLTNTDVPYYLSYTGQRVSEQYGRSDIWYRMYDELRLPIQVFALDAMGKAFPNSRHRIKMERTYTKELIQKERYTISKPFTPKSIEITVGGVLIKTIPITSPSENILISLEKNDLKNIHLVQGLTIFNEILNEPLKVSYHYNNIQPHFFAEPEYIAAQTPRNTRYILLNSLEKITISYLTGNIIKTFTKKELETLPPEKKHLSIKNFLPLNLTIDNQSSSPLTLQKTLENYSVSSYLKPGPSESAIKNFLNKSEYEIKGSVSVTQEPSTINAKKKETSTFSSNSSSKKLSELSEALQTIVSFDVKTITTPRKITLSPSSPDYCSSLFTLDLQDTTNPLLATKEYNDKRPFALTLTVKDAPEDDEDNAFGSSCKKLTFSLEHTR
jgi:hypothetical protein